MLALLNMPKLRPGFKGAFQFWGVAKWTKAPVFGIGIRRFESSRPSQFCTALILRFGIVFLRNILRKISKECGFGENLIFSYKK